MYADFPLFELRAFQTSGIAYLEMGLARIKYEILTELMKKFISE